MNGSGLDSSKRKKKASKLLESEAIEEGLAGEPATTALSVPSPLPIASQEREYDYFISAWPMILVYILILPIAIFVMTNGFLLIEPNSARVVMLFGRYKGTLKKPGFWFINPFCKTYTVSLKVKNFESGHIKVNDLRGSPIEIGAIVSWRVRDTAQALFDVEDYVRYVYVQTEASIRASAGKHPYDATEESGEHSLRGDSDQVNLELRTQLSRKLSMAGVDVVEVKLSHLAYAPEIAAVMLRRQQAEAIIDARTRIVEGAVGMVKHALKLLEDDKTIHLSDDRKTEMVSNLLVVLCSEQATQPVINTGSLYQ